MTSPASDPFAPDAAGQRREARERAIELLYEAGIKLVDIETIIGEATIEPDQMALILARGVFGRLDELDSELEGLLHAGWSIHRLGTLDRWILRLGLYEIRHRKVPHAVVIDEAVELAKQYGATDESGRFVNGVLAAAIR
ncbi:MAG: N utilization substance protein B [Candidatus Poriferisodalaceae bacterium]